MKRMTLRVATMLLGLGLAPALAAQDDPRAEPLFNAAFTEAEVLAAFKAKNKEVLLVLTGGTTYQGKVKDVGTAAVLLTGLRGKEFYDAWIPLDTIVAMEERVRMR